MKVHMPDLLISGQRYGVAMILIASLVISGSSLAQDAEIATLKTDGKAYISLTDSIPNIQENIDVNGDLTAGLKIETNLKGLTFDSNNGVFQSVQSGDGFLLYLSPDERMVTIYKQGFAPLEIILSEYEIELESGRVWVIKINGEDRKTRSSFLIPVSISVTPGESSLVFDEEEHEINYMFEGRFPESTYGLQITKAGFVTIKDSIDVKPDKINTYEYTLLKDGFISFQINTGGGGSPSGLGFASLSFEFQNRNRSIYELYAMVAGGSTKEPDAYESTYTDYLLFGVGMSKRLGDKKNRYFYYGANIGMDLAFPQDSEYESSLSKTGLDLNIFSGFKIHSRGKGMGFYMEANYGLLSFTKLPFLEIGAAYVLFNKW